MIKMRGLLRLGLSAAFLAGLLHAVVSVSQSTTQDGFPSNLLPNDRNVTNFQPPSSDAKEVGLGDPKLILENIARAILAGPPLTADFRGQVDLQVALNPMKSLRGQSNVVPMTGMFSSLGRGSGLARWQLSVGSPHATTMNFYCQQLEMVANSTSATTLPEVVSIQPKWYQSLGLMENPSQASGTFLYGSPVSLIQWLPHHFEFWYGDLDQSTLKMKRLADHPIAPAIASETSTATIVGRVRSTVATHHGIQVPTSGGSAARGTPVDLADWTEFFNWARHVPLPSPHVFEIKLEEGPGEVWRLASVSFLRIHPLRPELEEMVRWDWSNWQVASSLSVSDVTARTKNP